MRDYKQSNKYGDAYYTGVCPNCSSSSFKHIRSIENEVVKCTVCGCVYPYLRLTESSLKKSLEGANANLDLSKYGKPEIKRFEFEKFFLSKGININILEVGSGDGRFLLYLKEKGFVNVTGLEPLQRLVDFSRAKGLNIQRGTFTLERGKELFKKNSFDVIIFMDVFYYFPDIDDAFNAIEYLLKKDGLVYIRTHSIKSCYYNHKRHYLSRFGEYAQCLTDFKTMVRILEKRGFEVLRNYKHGGNFDIINNPEFKIFNSILRRILNFVFKIFGREDRYSLIAKRAVA